MPYVRRDENGKITNLYQGGRPPKMTKDRRIVREKETGYKLYPLSEFDPQQKPDVKKIYVGRETETINHIVKDEGGKKKTVTTTNEIIAYKSILGNGMPVDGKIYQKELGTDSLPENNMESFEPFRTKILEIALSRDHIQPGPIVLEELEFVEEDCEELIELFKKSDKIKKHHGLQRKLNMLKELGLNDLPQAKQFQKEADELEKDLAEGN